MSDREPSTERVVQAVYAFAAELMRNGSSTDQIETQLVEKGLDEKAAATVVSNLVRLHSKANRKVGMKNMISGALWCIGGIVVTAATYMSASPGGKYVIAWGAIAFGAIQFFRGIGQACQG